MELASKIKQFFELNYHTYGLTSSEITVKPVLNWGGFVNSSFFICDGHKQFHLKVSCKKLAGLELYFKASDILEKHYHSPKAHAWIEIPGTKFKGILFDFIQGHTVDSFSDKLIKKLSKLLYGMQQDAELKSLLDEKEVICSQTYFDVYNNRFSEDLKLIEGNLPPFVSKATFDFMWAEAGKLKNFVSEAAEFHVQTDTPIHSDIWANNVMITPKDEWFLIDWDGLKIGDPSLDYAMLLGPSKNDWSRKIDPLQHLVVKMSSDAIKRVHLYHQAMLLDWIIDPLADWVEAAHHPEWKDAVQNENKKNHIAALQVYKTMYSAL